MSQTFNLLDSSVANSSFVTFDLSEFLLNVKQLQTEPSFDIKTKKIQDEVYEVLLTTVVNGREVESQKIRYTATVSFIGFFQIKGFNEQEFEQLIRTHAAQMLYPFCRAQISLILSQTAFPKIVLPTISFFDIYEQNKEPATNEGEKQEVEDNNQEELKSKEDNNSDNKQ